MYDSKRTTVPPLVRTKDSGDRIPRQVSARASANAEPTYQQFQSKTCLSSRVYQQNGLQSGSRCGTTNSAIWGMQHSAINTPTTINVCVNVSIVIAHFLRETRKRCTWPQRLSTSCCLLSLGKHLTEEINAHVLVM